MVEGWFLPAASNCSPSSSAAHHSQLVRYWIQLWRENCSVNIGQFDSFQWMIAALLFVFGSTFKGGAEYESFHTAGCKCINGAQLLWVIFKNMDTENTHILGHSVWMLKFWHHPLEAVLSLWSSLKMWVVNINWTWQVNWEISFWKHKSDFMDKSVFPRFSQDFALCFIFEEKEFIPGIVISEWGRQQCKFSSLFFFCLWNQLHCLRAAPAKRHGAENMDVPPPCVRSIHTKASK